MTVTSAIIGQLSIFSIGDATGGGSTTYTKVSQEVLSISSPGITRDALDATHLESPDDFREFIAGLKDGGQAGLTFHYIPSASDALFDLASGDGVGDFQITAPNGVKLKFSGVVTSWQPDETSSDKMTGSIEIKVSGKPTLEAP